MFIYFLVFISTLLVDLVPFFGPPAWTVMVFFHLKFDLNIWIVLVAGVVGSSTGRYLLARYIPYLSTRVLTSQKDADLQFLGEKLTANKWVTQAFVLFYTLIPVPSTPLFTVVGLSKINPMRVIPVFFTGKFISDGLMIYTGEFAAAKVGSLFSGYLSLHTIIGAAAGVTFMLFILFLDWTTVIKKRKLKLVFSIWK